MCSKKARLEMQAITGLKHEVLRKNRVELKSWQKKLSQETTSIYFGLSVERDHCMEVSKLLLM